MSKGHEGDELLQYRRKERGEILAELKSLVDVQVRESRAFNDPELGRWEALNERLRTLDGLIAGAEPPRAS